ncbi:MAG: hypothetical protein GF363_09235, partial [Chitinivibrionales bacterium]|nr:hypothetical protein [Chitinivibrionales bacterium]
MSCRIAVVAVLVWGGCTHDTDLPLRNDVPKILNVTPHIGEEDTVTLYYPRTEVCTLTVSDLNNESLLIDYSGTWEGKFTLVENGTGPRKIVPKLT